MSLSVGRCLRDGVGETERADCGGHDQRAGAANLLRGAQFADPGVPFVRSPHGQWGNTVAYLHWGQTLYPAKKLVFLWDGASYHRGEEMQKFLAPENASLPAADWKVTCMRCAPHAPEQNPTEEVGLKGKTQVRKQFALNKTFAQVKRCFSTFLKALRFTSTKLRWYWPTEQMIEETYICLAHQDLDSERSSGLRKRMNFALLPGVAKLL